MSLQTNLKKILEARLNDFKVPNAIIDGLVDDIIAESNKPETHKYGAVVMTGEASQAADRIKKGEGHSPAAKPRVV